MSAADAMAKLFPYDSRAGRRFYYPPPDHAPKGSPKNRLPIDEKIDELKRRGKQGKAKKLHSQSDLGAAPIVWSPNYHARLAIAASVDRASCRLKLESNNYRMFNIHRSATRASKSIAEAAIEAKSVISNSVYDIIPLIDLDVKSERSAEFKVAYDDAIRALNRLSDETFLIGQSFNKWINDEKLTSKTKKLWEEVFSEYIGCLWYDLTGAPPKLSASDFLEFLEAAYESIGGSDINWETTIRNMAKKVRIAPATLHFDRFKRFDPLIEATWERPSTSWRRSAAHFAEGASPEYNFQRFMPWPSTVMRLRYVPHDVAAAYLASFGFTDSAQSDINTACYNTEIARWLQQASKVRTNKGQFALIYNNISARVDFSWGNFIFIGHIIGISEYITFEIRDPQAVEALFRKCVDDYLKRRRENSRGKGLRDGVPR
ncbi:hypothetical protein [Methylocella sp.]|uniref:hypothetical protein n=1 Tax=Methylocella sp. TaxID=1978226 RepID=UPI0037843BC1